MAPMKNHNPESQYFRVVWTEGINSEQRYILGQPITTHKSHVWAINKTSYWENDTVYVRRFTVYIKNGEGVVTKYVEIENPVNITLVPNFKDMIEI